MASGQTLLTLNALSGTPPPTGFARIGSRNNHTILEFDAAVDESIIFEETLPRNYAGNGLTVTVVWTAAAATSGDTRWIGAWERHQDETTDLDADSFATAQGANGAAPSVNGTPQYTELTFTDGAQIDGLTAGESFRLKLTREATNVADTMAGYAQLLRVELKET